MKSTIRAERLVAQKEILQTLSSKSPPTLQRCIELANEKGSSSWLTVLPSEDHGFHLSKGDFRDALCLRYGWQLPDVPSKCSCGKRFDVDHAMICPKGGFPTLRHNEVRDITADLLTESCYDVAIEPQLHPLDGETFQHKTAITDDQTRLDISARGVWQHSQHAFFDVRVFYPNVRSNMQATSLASAYRNHENEKKREYGERVRELENGNFTPLVFSSTGAWDGRGSNSVLQEDG